MGIKYHYDLIQGSEEWHKGRTGILTVSNLKHILTTATLKEANNDKTRMLAYEMAAQRITEYVEPSYDGFEMMRGHVEEVYAKELYTESYSPVNDCGFIVNNSLGFNIGYSPDAVIGGKGKECAGIEVKSRIQKYQIQTIALDEIPTKPDDYTMQLQGGLFVTGWEYIDFVSYSNGLPMYVKRVTPDVEIQAAIKSAAINFESRVNDLIKSYRINSKDLIVAERKDFDMSGEIK